MFAAAPRLLSLVGRLAPVVALACSFDPYETGVDDDGVALTQGTGSEGTDTTGGSSGGPGGGTTAPPCADACEPGAATCEDGGVVRCGEDERGCLVWLPPEPCPEGQLCGDGACAAGPGFMGEPTVWAVPAGGRAGEGFAAAAGEPAAVGDDAWDLLDLDGDGALDLVLTAAAYPSGDGFVTRNKGFPFAPFWQVHRGGGADGFQAKPEAWLLPVGVGLASRGVVSTAGEPVELGDQVWALRDVDGDDRPDLVVTGAVGPQKGELRTLGAPDAPHWDVYLNTGTGFAAMPQTWTLPPVPDGLFVHHVHGALHMAGGPAWSLLDLDGDGWGDLVITGRSKYPIHVVPGFPDSQHWEIYRGGPTGFVEPMGVWMLPQGGGALTGFAGNAAGLYGEAKVAGDQAWALLDLDGDRRLELVVTGQLDDPAIGPVALGVDGAPGWSVYRAGAGGFDEAPEPYPIPAGGGGAGGRGFYALRGGQTVAGVVTEPYDANGWEVLDVDGDGRLDLVVTNEALEIPGGVYKRQALGGEAAPYWDVYLATDDGFAGPERWPTPTGGLAGRGFLWGRGLVSPVPEVEGTVLWTTGDLDGDRRPEIVVTALAAPTGQGNLWGWRVPGLDDGATHWRVHWQYAK